MGGCASKPRELRGETLAFIWDEHREKEGGKPQQESCRQSLGFLLKELEAKEAEESKTEHREEGSEAETITSVSDGKSTRTDAMDSMEDEMIVPEKENIELPVCSLLNAV